MSETTREAVGWLASVLLLATLVAQVRAQWRSGTAKGLSSWHFVGQIAASAGFVAYSALVGNVVFVVTNAANLLTAITGQIIFLRNRAREAQVAPRRARRRGESAPKRASRRHRRA